MGQARRGLSYGTGSGWRGLSDGAGVESGSRSELVTVSGRRGLSEGVRPDVAWKRDGSSGWAGNRFGADSRVWADTIGAWHGVVLSERTGVARRGMSG